jgi:hypothetical protein
MLGLILVLLGKAGTVVASWLKPAPSEAPNWPQPCRRYDPSQDTDDEELGWKAHA